MQIYRNGLEISDCQGLREEWEWQGSGHGYKKVTGRNFYVMEMNRCGERGWVMDLG